VRSQKAVNATKFFICVAVLFSTAVSASASELTYTPVNPNFGGSPFNGSWLLQQDAANNYRYLTNPATAAASVPATAGQSTLKQFQNTVTNALLAEVAQQVAQDILGQNGQTSGSFNLGGELINFTRANGEITVNLTDPTNGGTTTIQIPQPQF